MKEIIYSLIEFSRRYGSDERYVLAGGGNTSAKLGDVLYVKASGTRLRDIDERGFVKMSLPSLHSMFNKEYPPDDAAREASALSDMLSALLPGETGRPSVECMLHALFPQTYVLHLHPALVNGFTCGVDGARRCAELFGEDAVWIGLTKPGYILAKACRSVFEAYQARSGRAPDLLFMQNHGVIAAADSIAALDSLMKRVISTIAATVNINKNININTEQLAPPDTAIAIAPALRTLYARLNKTACAVIHKSDLIDSYIQTAQTAGVLTRPFNPDQIVYCKDAPLILEQGCDPEESFCAYIESHGYPPKIVALIGAAIIALGATKKEADTALSLFLDAARIARYSQAFGGPLPLTDEFSRFILQWEVENYRQRVSFPGGAKSRSDEIIKGKVCVVTGGAQGFGEGIARALAEQGGYVVIADMNEAGAQAAAQSICAECGAGASIGIKANVADEASVKAMVDKTIAEYGGLDVMVSCAGIAIAGGLDTLTLDQFQKVTAVNYTGYYLCAKYASAVMKTQRKYAPDRISDIIEINSKSGLEGSKANFAYAGSKFGGVGLTQSFALELAQYGIKVNAVCPGNLLDGPLWSDPERGLLRQYLEAGKVPGANTTADVRRYYESKVPLGRGCQIADVVRAVIYIIEQQYETGQALPVTGGQVMLS
jgi:NAD(P)-dependent dehydrogenase (short-subunit alcohol dehydrogenase family)/rhamnose utilization protein RhaD (predicted bifunctional aldolase and dehydrogenase)